MPPAPANFRDWKHSLQNTGRPCVGLKGTVVSLPQFEHIVVVSTRSRPLPPPAGRLARFPLQALHRFGSFLKFFSAKNCCSPAVQTNSAPQSTHVRTLSWNSIGPTSSGSVYEPRRERAPLLGLAPELLSITLARQSLFCSALVAWLQVEGVLLDVLDDVFLLHLPLKPSESALNRFALLDLYLSHEISHPFRGWPNVCPNVSQVKYARLARINADSRRKVLQGQRNTPPVTVRACNLVFLPKSFCS